MQQLWNSEQICEYLQISYSSFLKYTREDHTFPVRKLGGEWKADPDELKAWFKSQPVCGRNTNVVQMAQRRKRGRPPVRPVTPAGGWQVRIPD